MFKITLFLLGIFLLTDVHSLDKQYRTGIPADLGSGQIGKDGKPIENTLVVSDKKSSIYNYCTNSNQNWEWDWKKTTHSWEWTTHTGNLVKISRHYFLSSKYNNSTYYNLRTEYQYFQIDGNVIDLDNLEDENCKNISSNYPYSQAGYSNDKNWMLYGTDGYLNTGFITVKITIYKIGTKFGNANSRTFTINPELLKSLIKEGEKFVRIDALNNYIHEVMLNNDFGIY